MDYGPIVRIALRYFVGAALMGSEEIGNKLAADPDLVAVGSLVVGFLVEGAYAWAKKRGGAT